MELKFESFKKQLEAAGGSNRTFMELKCGAENCCRLPTTGSNRTFMELKCASGG